MQLSKHFTLAQLTHTSRKIANTPDSPIIVPRLRAVCENVLERVFDNFGPKVVVHSGYRNHAVNVAVGGSATSQHCKGEAVDFHVEGCTVYEVASWIASNDDMNFDQLILEEFVPGQKSSGWVHCSYATHNRGDIRTKFKHSKTYWKGLLLDPAEAQAKSVGAKTKASHV